MSFAIASFAKQAVAPWDAEPRQARVALVCYCVAVGSAMLMEKTFTIFETPARNLLEDKSIVDTAYTILLITDAVGGPIFGKVAQRYGVRYNLVIGMSLMLLSTAFLIPGVTLLTFYSGHFIGGLAISSVYAPCNIAAVQLMPRKKQGMASSASMFSIVAFCAVFVFPIKQIIEQYGANIAYGVQGLGISATLCLCAFVLPKPPQQSGPAEESKNADELAGTHHSTKLSFAVLYIAYLAGVSTYYFLEAQIQPILEETLPHSSTILEVALPLFLLEEGFARILWGYVACTRSATLCLVAGAVLVVVGMNFWALFCGAWFGELMMTAVSFLGASSLWPLMPVLVARIFPPHQAMALYALLNTAGFLAGLVSGPVAAMLSSAYGWPITLHIFSFFPTCVVAAIMIRLFKDESRALLLAQTPNPSRQASPQDQVEL